MKKYICIHGHFYQPPRENAWLDTVEQQESAKPFHDWNERINFECYAPNAAARILNSEGNIIKIRNNYNRISFNFGSTLLSWLEHADPNTYRLLLAADVRSQELFGGHGNAMAQVHGHLILPLCNYRDKVTQVIWGIRDFEHRFKRYPEGMWLAETAVDTESLEVLAANGIQFTVLAPRQAKAIRRIGQDNWTGVVTETIDTRQPYWCTLPSGRRIALFFYDGNIAHEVAFNGILNHGRQYAQRLMSAFSNNQEPQLVHVATDGETYGHHHRYGEMALADAINYIEDLGKAKLTNYGQYLELFPPTWEVQIHDNSSWSCVHGVERWRNNCGCNSGGNGHWHQLWRKPLRDALDWLRNSLVPLFEKEASLVFRDPWAARNDYIAVMLHRSEDNINAFFKRNAKRQVTDQEKTNLLRLLEMQKHCILMYTSCGWFFDEISGIETNQILQYALRAMDYANDVFGLQLHKEFENRLKDAPSNVFPNGAVSYLSNVVPTKVDLQRVAMHFAASALFENKPGGLDLFNYTLQNDFFDKLEAGTLRLAVGRIRIKSSVTLAQKAFSFVVIYLGQQHIIGSLSAEVMQSDFDKMYGQIKVHFNTANLGEMLNVMQQYFGPAKFTLSSLFLDEKVKIITQITENNLLDAEKDFHEAYHRNYQLMQAFQENKIPVPDVWRNIATYVINSRLKRFFTNGNTNILELKNIQEDITRWDIKIENETTLQHVIGKRIFREISKIELDTSPIERLHWLNDALQIIKVLGLKPDIWMSQNIFMHMSRGYRKGLWVFVNDEWEKGILKLGELLKVNIHK